MKTANKCRVCGTTNPAEQGAKWLGVKKSLCSNCIEKCGLCDGRGYNRPPLASDTVRCYVCRGKGTVVLEQAREPKVKGGTSSQPKSDDLEVVGF